MAVLDAHSSTYRVTFAVLALAGASYSLLQSLVSPVLPLLQAELHTSQANVTWLLTAYLLVASVATPILGRVGDMIGKKTVLVWVLASLTIGSVLAALSTSIGLMIVARSIQGIGGGVIPLAFGIVRDSFPREKVASGVGTIASLLGIGGGIGLVLAGPIVNALDYHWLFWIPAIVTAAVAAATHFFVPESATRTPGTISWLAAVLMSGWLVALLLAVSEAPTWGWGSARVIGLFVATVVLAGAWITAEQRAERPLIDLRMMRLHAVWTTNIVSLLFGVVLYSMFAFLPEFIQTPSSAGYGFGASVTESGLLVLPMAVTMFFAGHASGSLTGRFGARFVLIVGSFVCIVPFAILAFAHDDVWEIIVATAILGVGIGFAFSAMSNIIVDAVPSNQTGVASGMNANIRTIGGAIGAAVLTSVITAGTGTTALPKESGYVLAFVLLGISAIAATAAALIIPNLHAARDAHQQDQAAMNHPEAALAAAGTIVGDDPE
ncbi:MAG: MFS transporter [Gordonia polyisoprenivorans]|nr:MFS transporter [Gordonia polyisoprenivorans]